MATRVLSIQEMREFSVITVQDIIKAARIATEPGAKYINAEVVRNGDRVRS